MSVEQHVTTAHSPEAVVAAGHDQGAVSVEMDLQQQIRCLQVPIESQRSRSPLEKTYYAAK